MPAVFDQDKPIMFGKRCRDLTGEQFGRLTVVGFAGRDRRGNLTWNCICDCGTTLRVPGDELKSGGTKSCSCMKRQRFGLLRRKHGLSKSLTYNSWKAMLWRCLNPKAIHYANYGGRGITVCERWRNSFEVFYADMGPRPGKEFSIDRIDNNGNYEPGNCRWATKQQQMSNMRRVGRRPKAKSA